LPLGILQLWHSVNDGYFEARTLGYLTEPGNAALEWMRMPGDLILIIGGVLPFLWITYLGIRFGVKATATELPPETLYVEETVEAAEDRTGLMVTVGGGAAGTVGEVPRSRSRYASDRRDEAEER
jgi:nitric oxide reductase subunit B